MSAKGQPEIIFPEDPQYSFKGFIQFSTTTIGSLAISSSSTTEGPTAAAAARDEETASPSPHIAAEVIWDAFTIFKLVILSIIVLATIFGNAMVLIAVLLNRNKNLRSSTHWFIANLATADMFVGILVLPFLASLTITGNWYFGQTYCTLWAYIHFWLCSASILSVCAICIDRFIGVSFPLKHYRLMNKRKVFMVSCGVWALALALSALPLAVWPEDPSKNMYECKINQQLGHVLVASFGILYIPTVIMLVLYGKIFMITLEHFRIMREGFVRTDAFMCGSGAVGSSGSTDYSNASTSGHEFQSSGVKTSITSLSSSNSNEGDLSIIGNGGAGKNNPKSSIAMSNGKLSFKSYVKNGGLGPKGSADTVEQNQLVLNRARQVRVAMKLATVVGAFVFSYVPFFTVFLINALWPGTISVPVFMFFGWIRYFNSCLNPIIYAAMLPAFTKAFKNILMCNLKR